MPSLRRCSGSCPTAGTSLDCIAGVFHATSATSPSIKGANGLGMSGWLPTISPKGGAAGAQQRRSRTEPRCRLRRESEPPERRPLAPPGRRSRPRGRQSRLSEDRQALRSLWAAGLRALRGPGGALSGATDVPAHAGALLRLARVRGPPARGNACRRCDGCPRNARPVHVPCARTRCFLLISVASSRSCAWLPTFL